MPPSNTRPISHSVSMFITRCMTPKWRKPEVTRRHHSPAATAGPHSPHCFSKSVVRPVPAVGDRRNTLTFKAISTQVTDMVEVALARRAPLHP